MASLICARVVVFIRSLGCSPTVGYLSGSAYAEVDMVEIFLVVKLEISTAASFCFAKRRSAAYSLA